MKRRSPRVPFAAACPSKCCKRRIRLLVGARGRCLTVAEAQLLSRQLLNSLLADAILGGA